MSRRMKRKRQPAFERATPMVLPGSGGLMYVAPGALQSTQGQVFYGSSAKNVATGQSALFSPGIPLQPQKNVNPGGYPIQWRFPVSANVFPVDRTSQNPDIPSFQQLRNLAKLFSGITICERVWADMVPRMRLKIELKPEYVAAGADEKDYQADISYFLNWFESPDKMHDQHSWLRMCLREQTQIDELYLYKRKKRGGGLHALEIVSGDQVKPLLDDWGKIPQPPNYAYQQYPWGIPGAWFRADEMIHYQESPAADNPYGQSRVERIIMLVNQALRKQKKDLSHFTEGNIPQGMMLVPDNATWTPDQIDAFEQAWNALLAGNASQQVRMRFTQPGMKYQAFEQYTLDPTFDKFLLNISVSVYGLSMQDVSFTEDIHKSSGDSQQNVTYRRTIDPLAVIYASFITQCINNDFPDELHGEMFVASFTGFDEEEDVSELATAYSTLTNSGILGITNAGKLLKLPDDPNAPYIGRILVTKDGPVFLDDMASDKMRNAQMQSQLAGYQQAANPPQPQPQDAPGQQGAPQKSGPPNEKVGQQQEQKQAPGNEKPQTTQPSSEQASEAAPTPVTQAPQKPEGEQEQPTPEEKLHESDIKEIMKQDQDEPFSPLERSFERHEPGGHDHDQKTHGDRSHPAYGAKHDKTPEDREAMQDATKVQSAQDKVDAARQAYQDAATPAAKAKAAATLDQAKADLKNTKAEISAENKQDKAEAKQAKAEATAQAKEERAEATAAKKSASAQLKASAQQAHVQKQAAAAQAKAARMAATAQKKAQVAAAKAARASAKQAKAQASAQMKAAKAQAKAAKVLQSLIKTVGTKAALYNALASRKVSQTWSAQDAHDAASVARDLHQLLEMVNSHTDEENATRLLTNMTGAISNLSSQRGVSQARAGVLEKLASRIQQHIALDRFIASYNDNDDKEEDTELNEEWMDIVYEEETEEEQAAERRYTMGELIDLLQEQLQAQTATEDVQPGALRSAKTRAVGEPDSRSREDELGSEYRRWRQRAMSDVKAGHPVRPFVSDLIPADIHARLTNALETATTPDEVRDAFNRARDRETDQHDEPIMASKEDLAQRIHEVFHSIADRARNALASVEN